jgi:hypothetical protein
MTYIDIAEILVDKQAEKSYFQDKETNKVYELHFFTGPNNLTMKSCIPRISHIKKDSLKIEFKKSKILLNKIIIEYTDYYYDDTENKSSKSFYLKSVADDFLGSKEWEQLTPLELPIED